MLSNSELFISMCKNKPFTEWYDLYPYVSSTFYTPFEKAFQIEPHYNFVSFTWPWLPMTCVLFYFLMVRYGPLWMEHRERVACTRPLACWNFAMSLFSFMGAMRMVPQLLYLLSTLTLRETICKPACLTYGQGASGFWTVLFVYSKVLELGDTMFLVLRKNRLMFLHWYHHATVLLYCWHSLAYMSTVGLYFIAMNYSVHAVMYGYYFLQSVGKVPSWFRPELITIAQIAQMIVGVMLCVGSVVYSNDGKPCAISNQSTMAGLIMYGSYMVLFIDFFVKRFLWKMGKKS